MRPLISPAEASARLSLVFPRASFDTVLSNPLAGWAVAVMIYVGAVAEADEEPVWARPSTVTWQQEDVLATRTSDSDRLSWRDAAARTKVAVEQLLADWGLPVKRVYADNTRETLRDETFRKWNELGAVRKRTGVATSSGKPRWALEPHFADLFDPSITGEDLTERADHWIASHMDAGARLRAQYARTIEAKSHAVSVTLPSGETRQLEPGASSVVLKGVVEEWVPRRLAQPVVLTISEPGAKLLVTDELLLTGLGITLDVTRILPDALIADLGAEPVEFWIVEAVASDGPVTDARKALLLEWATEQSINPSSCRFLSAFESRGAQTAKRRLKDLAVGTFAWFADEPERELAWDSIPS